MRTSILASVFLTVVMAVPVLGQDRDAIEAVVHEYLRTDDAGELDAQAELMTDDRSWQVSGAGRRLDQAKNMEIQKKARAASDDTSTTVSEARDLVIRLFSDDVALASFYWYSTVLPAPEGGQPAPTLVSHVLVKEGADWKIAHTHISPMYLN